MLKPFQKLPEQNKNVAWMLNNINPRKWLEYVLEHIADYPASKVHAFLPNNIDPAKIQNFKKFYEM